MDLWKVLSFWRTEPPSAPIPAPHQAAPRSSCPSGFSRTDEQRRGEWLELEARRHHDVTTRLFAIPCPCLVACGRYDGIAPPANSEAIATRVPGAELRIYEGGHAFFFQDPTALSEILDFLAAS